MTFDELMRLGHVTVLNVGTNHVIVTFLLYDLKDGYLALREG